MKWRAFVVLAIGGLAVLLTATPAVAKGADQATITGPGISTPIVVGGDGEPGSSTDLGQLAESSGLFTAMFGSDASFGSQLMATKPAGSLGPRFTVSYRVPDSPKPDVVTQDLYPLAAGGPVTYTAGGQPALGTKTTAGWYHAPGSFRALLTSIGVPGLGRPAAGTNVTATPPPAQPAAAANATRESTPASGVPWAAIIGGAATACVIVALGVVLMRRSARTRLASR
jgi:hypothetical protein